MVTVKSVFDIAIRSLLTGADAPTDLKISVLLLYVHTYQFLRVRIASTC